MSRLCENGEKHLGQRPGGHRLKGERTWHVGEPKGGQCYCSTVSRGSACGRRGRKRRAHRTPQVPGEFGFY